MSDLDTSDQRLPGLIPEAAQEDKNQIQEPADAEESQSKHPDQSGTDLTHIESMNPKPAQEQAKEERNPTALMDVSKISVDILVGVVIYHIDDRLLVLGLRRSVSGAGTAAGTELGIWSNFFSTIFAIHTKFLFPLFLVSNSDTCFSLKYYMFLFLP